MQAAPCRDTWAGLGWLLDKATCNQDSRCPVGSSGACRAVGCVTWCSFLLLLCTVCCSKRKMYSVCSWWGVCVWPCFQCLHRSPTFLWWGHFSNTPRVWFKMTSWQILRNFGVWKCSVILLSGIWQCQALRYIWHRRLVPVHVPFPRLRSPLASAHHQQYSLYFLWYTKSSACEIHLYPGRLKIRWYRTSSAWQNLLSTADVKTLLRLLAGSLNSRHWMLACLDFWLPSLLF